MQNFEDFHEFLATVYLKKLNFPKYLGEIDELLKFFNNYKRN